MFVASDNINGIGSYQWETPGDAGAIEVPDALGHELISRPGEHYWAVDGTKPAPKPEPKPEPKVELKEDESTGDDVAEAIEAANVAARKPAAKTRKSTKE